MKAIVYRLFGSPDVLEFAEVDRPTAGVDEVLVRIHAAGLNPYDWHFMRGEPLFFRPMMGLGIRKPRRATILGSDVAGVVEAVGTSVTRFRPGDEVYGLVGQGARRRPQCGIWKGVTPVARSLSPSEESKRSPRLSGSFAFGLLVSTSGCSNFAGC